MADTNPIAVFNGMIKKLLWPTFILALLYIAYQLVLDKTTANSGLVIALMVNSFIVFACFKYLNSHLPQLLSEILAQDASTKHRYFSEVFSPWMSGLSGLIWGGLLGGIVYANNLIPEHEGLSSILFSLFLGTHNILIGMAIYALLRHMHWCFFCLGKAVPIYLWNRSDEATVNYFKVNRTITTTVSIVSALALIGIFNFSGINTDSSPVLLFTGICFALVMVAYVIPLLPLSGRLRKIKDRELNALGGQIESLYRDNHPFDPNTYGTYEVICKLRSTVEGVKTFPPVQERAYETAIINGVLTQTPALAKYFSVLPGVGSIIT